MNNSTLTPDQRNEAQKYEQIVDDGQLGYVAIGSALMEIQDRQLHDGDFGNYVLQRFDIKPKAAYRTIRAAKVANRLMGAELPAPRNEGQSHLLHELINDADDQIEVWQQLLEHKDRPTMGDIKRFAINWKQKDITPEEGDFGDEVEASSSYHLPAINVPPDVNPISCLDNAVQQLRTVANMVTDDLDDFSGLLPHIEEAEQFLSKIKHSLTPAKAVA